MYFVVKIFFFGYCSIIISFKDDDFDAIWDKLPAWREKQESFSLKRNRDFAKDLAKISIRAKNVEIFNEILTELVKSESELNNAEVITAVYLYAAMTDKEHFIALYPWMPFFPEGNYTTRV